MGKQVTINYINGESRNFEVEDTSVIDEAALFSHQCFILELVDDRNHVVNMQHVIGITFDPEELEVLGDDED